MEIRPSRRSRMSAFAEAFPPAAAERCEANDPVSIAATRRDMT